MAEKEKVYQPETINDNPLPGQEGKYYDPSQNTSKGTFEAKQIRNQKFPYGRKAVELISSALNTKSKKILGEFELVQNGAIQIGKYEEDENGDVRITPNGITARDSSGINTFVLDALTGDATFKGTIQTGALVSGDVIVGNNTWIISGDPDKPRIILYNDGIPEIVLGELSV